MGNSKQAERLNQPPPLSWDLTSPTAKYYRVQQSKATYIGNGACYQLTTSSPIIGSEATATITVSNYGRAAESIVMGVLTEERRKKVCSTGADKQVLGFYTYPKNQDGDIWIDGQQVTKFESSLYIGEGQGLTINVNKERQEVVFTRGSHKLHSVSLSKYWWNSTNIYFFVVMREEGASVIIE